MRHKKRYVASGEEPRFHNTSSQNMTYEDVFEKMKGFMQTDPRGQYIPMIGCDSQVHGGETWFVTVILLQRLGKGTWYCYRYNVFDRPMKIHEKLLTETLFIQEAGTYFTGERYKELEDIILPYIYKGASLAKIEGHLDAGDKEQNETRKYVTEMIGILKGAGLIPRIKPESIASSWVADKYTKKWVLKI